MVGPTLSSKLILSVCTRSCKSLKQEIKKNGTRSDGSPYTNSASINEKAKHGGYVQMNPTKNFVIDVGYEGSREPLDTNNDLLLVLGIASEIFITYAEEVPSA